MSKYRAEQCIAISGWECGTEIELTMVVNFTAHPGCKQTLTEPGEEPSIEVNSVRFFDRKDELKLPWSITERFTSSDNFKSWLMSEAQDQRETALADAETVSEGTPVSPPFATEEELIEYLAENGDFWDQKRCKLPYWASIWGGVPGVSGWGRQQADHLNSEAACYA